MKKMRLKKNLYPSSMTEQMSNSCQPSSLGDGASFQKRSSKLKYRGLKRILVALLLLSTQLALAEEIYRHVAPDGSISYSSTPPNQSSQPIELAPLQRESVDSRIKELKAKTPTNCSAHGGIDCSQGTDADGSVICTDGFRDAVLPYRFSCVEANLSVQQFSIDSEEGQKPVRKLLDQSFVQKPRKFRLLLRNRSAAKAENISVSFSLNREKVFAADGPNELPAYGLAEYEANIPPTIKAFNRLDMKRIRYKVRCRNCRSVITGAK